MTRGPVVFEGGVTSYPKADNMNRFPFIVQGAYQYTSTPGDAFFPYTAGNYETTGTVGGTVAQYSPYPGGVISLTTPATINDTAYVGLSNQSLTVLPQQQLWFASRLAIAASQQTNMNVVSGLFDNTTPASAANAIYFQKPAGQTAVNLVITKGGTTTTLQNVADFGNPTGAYNPPSVLWNGLSPVNGTVAFGGSGGTYATPTITLAGGGYDASPIVIPTGSTGSGAVIIVNAGGGTLRTPYTINAGSGYTTYTADVNPWQRLCLYWDGKGSLFASVNGNIVAQVGTASSTATYLNPITPGNTYNLATYGSFVSVLSSTLLTTAVTPVIPNPGNFYNMAPLVPMYGITGFKNNAAAVGSLYMSALDQAMDGF